MWSAQCSSNCGSGTVKAMFIAPLAGEDENIRLQHKHQHTLVQVLVLVSTGTSDQVQRCFQNLSSPVAARRCSSSSFRFCWGGDDGADGPSLHHQKLTSVLTMNHNMLTPTNATYWLPARCTCYLEYVCLLHENLM